MARAHDPSQTGQHDPTALGRAFRRRLEGGEILLGGMVFEMVRPAVVKIYRHAGFDFIYVDNEHALFAGLPATADFVLCARDNGLPVIAKCPDLSRTEVARLLEAGVTGIQLPRTETREDLLTLMDYMRFPPVGTRAAAPILGNVDYIWPADTRVWMEGANAATVVVGHIETRRGFENAEEIASTPGLDMLYVGPLDFSIAMGHPGEYDHPEMRSAMQHIADLCVRHGVAFGTTATGPETAGGWLARGARFFEVVDEMSLMTRGAVETVQQYRLAAQTVEATRAYLERGAT